MLFKKVVTKDWFGKIDAFDVIGIKKHEDGTYSCTFKNSIGDTEKQIVDETQLHLD